MSARPTTSALKSGFRQSLAVFACGLLLFAHRPGSAAVPADIDQSGIVDATDVQLVILAALGESIPYDADVDGVGGATAIDIQLVVNAALGGGPPTDPVQYTYTVVKSYPHDTGAFTQGLLIHNGKMFESTGLYGQSSLREVRLSDGAVQRKTNLPNSAFGEGIAVSGDRIVMLTWQNRTGYVYRQSDFELLSNFSYTTEGWGITTVGDRLIMSDGTGILRWLDPVSFAVTGTLTVKDGNTTLTRLNELEYINGEIWANVYLTDQVVRINPDSGHVTGYINFSGLLTAEERQGTNVLNGIAFDPGSGKIFVTGKLWPKLFEVTVQPVK